MNENFEKWPKIIKQSNLIGSVKMLNISAIEKFAINLGMGKLFSIS